MDRSQIDSISGRLTRLERANRRLKLLGVCSSIIVALLLLCGALPVAEQLIIRDRNNTVRFDIGVEPNRGVSQGIKVIDKEKRTRIEIGVNEAGDCFLVLTDQQGNTKDLAN